MGLSGKCDFEDTCSMFNTPQEILDKYKVYAYDNGIVPLKMETEKDLIAYYPYLVTMMGGYEIHLSKEPYIDQEEREWIQWKLNDLLKYYRKCKRKKEQFDKAIALKKIVWFDRNPRPFETELVNRVEKFGERATAEDLHDDVHDRMRKEWLDLMIKAGWDKRIAYKWVYGWLRGFKKWERENKE